MHEIIKLRNHGHNVCRGQRRVSGALERHGIYQCPHGFTAALWRYDAEGDGLAIAGLFPSEKAARDALTEVEPRPGSWEREQLRSEAGGA